MPSSRRKLIVRLVRHTKGQAMVEFALVTALLLLIVMGILDFGHAWFLRQTIVNASREGARYAVVYQVDANGNRLAPSAFSPTVQSMTNDYLSAILPSGSYDVPDPTGTGYTTGAAGQPVTVTVNATKTWFAIHGLMSFFGFSLPNPMTLTAATTMRCE